MNIIQKLVNVTRSSGSYPHVRHVFHKINSKRGIPTKQYSILAYRKQLLVHKTKLVKRTCSYNHNNGNIENDIDDLDHVSELYQSEETLQSLRNILYPDSKDPLIQKLNDCQSIQDVFDFIQVNSSKLKPEHSAQIVVVLWDLQKMFLYRYQMDNTLCSQITIDEYLSQLKTHPQFLDLLDFIRINYQNFNMEETSCVLMYLNKLGLSTKHDVLQLLVHKLCKAMKTDISLNALSRFIVTVCSEENLTCSFMLQDSIPIIEKELETCTNVENLKLLTISLYHLNYIISDDLIEKYVKKVKEFLNDNKLNSKEHRTLLKVIMLLNSSYRWNKNAVLVSEIMMLLKNSLHLLNVPDFFIVYEVLYKTHEPGELLTEMQRCASRLLLHLEDGPNLTTETKLKLLSATVCFSSPLHRSDYEKTLSNCIRTPLTKSSIFDLLRIATFIKPSNPKLCDELWDNILKTLKKYEIFKDIDTVLNLCQKYMNYYTDVHHRHYKFEREIIHWLTEQFRNGIISLIPHQMSLATAFILAFGNDNDLINRVTRKTAENWEQLNHADCLYLSKGLRIASDINSYITTDQVNTIKNAIDEVIDKKILYLGNSANISFLLKSSIYRKDLNRNSLNRLLLMLDPHQILSSNAIRNVIFALQSTNTLIPEMIDSITNYTIKYKDHLLGFNAEKVIYLCYHLGYLPQRLDELCQAVSDIIIRDQERISGLSYIMAALSLCFFNKLPNSFIKHIFNVTFLEKIDAELSTCYFKDIYPLRVRHNLMQLNRAVCLDYPQASIPWFHQKYVEQAPKYFFAASRVQTKENTLSTIKTYLLKIVNDPDCLVEDANSAYGYHINFVIHLDNNGNIIKPSDDNNATRVAILIMKPGTYTHINIQLRGQYQLKKRHLEMLGYKVAILDLNKWNSLIYGEEKMDLLLNIIFSGQKDIKSYSVVKI